MGWRAIRMGLDRPALLRTQVRALFRAAAGQELRIMIPMVSTATEMDEVPARSSRRSARSHGDARHGAPKQVSIGAMIEVPCLLFELDALMKKVDFVSSAATTSCSSCSPPIGPTRASAAATIRSPPRRCAR